MATTRATKTFEEAPKAVPAEKSTTRIIWEYGHRIVGAAILGMAWWEVQDGISLFLERFPDSYNLTPVFWAVVISISGIVALLFAYQTFGMAKVSKTTDKDGVSPTE